MKILSEKRNKQGKRVISVEIEEDEGVMVIKRDCYYQLGGQVGDIMHADVLHESIRVYWDSLGQKWEQA